MYGHPALVKAHAEIMKPASTIELPASLAKLARWRPALESLHFVDEALGIEVYCWAEDYGYMVKAFGGKRTKPDIYYRYRLTDAGKAQRDECAAKFIKDHQARAERKAKDKAERQAWQHDCKVGDVFKCSWGYDQTNIDYYQVTRLIGKHMVEVREICSQSDLTGFLQGECVPMPGNFKTEPDYTQEKVNGAYPLKTKEPRRMRPQRGGNGHPYLAVHEFANAYRIEAKEVAPGVKVFPVDHWTAYH